MTDRFDLGNRGYGRQEVFFSVVSVLSVVEKCDLSINQMCFTDKALLN